MTTPNRFRARWEAIPSSTRLRFVTAALVIAGVIGAYGVYIISGERSNRETKVVKATTNKVALGDQLLRDDIKSGIVRDKAEEELRDQAQDEKITALLQIQKAMENKESNALSSGQPQVPQRPQFGGNDRIVPSAEDLVAPRRTASPTTYPTTLNNAQPMEQSQPQMIEGPRFIGGIGHVGGDKSIESVAEKKKDRTVFLPPSLMEAVLLTGMDAFTAEGAKEHPQPMMLRIQAPAVLPNSVKADLQGCFVIVNGWGHLGAERVMTELVSLHCIAKSGESVIDQEITGILTDSDGKQGLKGIVVTKAGAHVGRVFIAGTFGGFGSSVTTSSTTTSISPLGSTQILDPSKTVQAGLGQGIKDSSADIRKIFLDLVKQTAPVIEIGATKKVGVVMTKGVLLIIRGYGQND